MTVAALADDEVRSALTGRGRVPDGAGPVWEGQDGKCTAVIALVMSTPAQADTDLDQVVKNLTANAELAARRSRSLKALAAAGWTLETPEPWTDGSGYTDIYIRMRKRFATDTQAREETRACVTQPQDDCWSLGWNEIDGDCEWEDEL